MPVKNNVTRLLDSRKIAYTAFELPAEKRSAVETAYLLEVSPSLVYKTIVVKRKKGKAILAVIPGDSQANLKKIASFVREKKVFLPTQDEAEEMTKLQTGGISPLALVNKGFDVILDVSARQYKEIHISGGQRGLNIRLEVDDLVKLTKAKVGEISSLR